MRYPRGMVVERLPQGEMGRVLKVRKRLERNVAAVSRVLEGPRAFMSMREIGDELNLDYGHVREAVHATRKLDSPWKPIHRLHGRYIVVTRRRDHAALVEYDRDLSAIEEGIHKARLIHRMQSEGIAGAQEAVAAIEAQLDLDIGGLSATELAQFEEWAREYAHEQETNGAL